MKKIVKFVALISFIALIVYFKEPIDNYLASFSSISRDSDNNAKKATICITQIAPHPSLDQIRLGIIEYLNEQGISYTLIYENAQGNIANANQIGVKFASLNPKPDVIVPITTPSALVSYKIALKAGIPVVFSAVTDPVSTKLVPSYKEAGEGITGVYDMPPVDQQLELIVEIFPYINTIGVLYNSGELNSVKMIQLFKEAAAKKDIKVIEVAISKSSEIPDATRKLAAEVPAIYIPNDNMVISAITSVLAITKAAKVPIFASDPESVEKGCLAAFTYSQKDIGRKTGELIVKVLKGTPVNEIEPAKPDKPELFINASTADELRIAIPKVVFTRAKTVFEAVK